MHDREDKGEEAAAGGGVGKLVIITDYSESCDWMQAGVTGTADGEQFEADNK